MIYVFASIVLFFGFLFWGIEKVNKSEEHHHQDAKTDYLKQHNNN